MTRRIRGRMCGPNVRDSPPHVSGIRLGDARPRYAPSALYLLLGIMREGDRFGICPEKIVGCWCGSAKSGSLSSLEFSLRVPESND